ncbi:MAG: CusA/CzcA family heavy metal efflux RND transporter [Christiangramia sp.]|uniref:CusA/CzcA family heavy metal efflux RND transporter n=1 Tax=Christiangramia sp. TaxID=1931228 RepID=UPI003241C763
MINKIIDFSINNKFIIGLCTLVLIAAGAWSMTQVPLDAQPDITNNQVQVITQAPNLGTEDIEQFVTYPVEIAMSNLPGVQEIRSVSRFGLSVVTIVFEDDLGTYLPRQLVAEQLNQVQEEIPEGFGKPSMGPISTGLGEIYQYTLEVDEKHQNQYSATELRSIQDWIVRRQMAMVPGVVEVNGVGGKIKQYEIAVDPDELKAIGLSISDIFAALSNNNQNTGGAYIEKNHQANFIRGEGLARNLDDLRNIVVANSGGIPITINDVADVRYGSAVRYGALTKNGKGEAVGGMVMMLKGANSNEVIENVKSRVAQIEKSLPEGISIKPFLDRSELISKTTSTVKGNLMEGGLIVIFVLVLLLGNWRGGLIVASTIPLSLLFAFILMKIFGVWANLMSLGAIDFGIIVDGAVIIVESTVFILYERLKSKPAINQTEMNEIAATSSKKMMNSAFFGQLIILIVFLPILALQGVEGKMFRPMALTFIFAMLGAMVLCLTYVPMISSLFLKPKAKMGKNWGDRFVDWIKRKYEPLLEKALNKAKIIMVVTIALLATAVFLFSRMGGEFIPQLDEGDIAFHVILQPGSSLKEGVQTSTKIEKMLLKEFPEIQQVITRFGVSEVPTDPMPMDIGDSFIILKDASEWTSADTKDELIEKIKEKLSAVAGVSYEFTQPVEMRFNELLTGVREDIAIKVYGEDLEILAEKAQNISNLIKDIDGVADMKVEATTGLPQITVQYDRSKLAQYGLQINDLNQQLESAFAGGKAGVIFEGEKRFDLVVRLQEKNRTDIANIKNLFLNLPSGQQVPFQEVSNISYQPGPMQISRDNTNRRTYVGVNIRNRDVKSVVQDIEAKLDAELQLPAGYYIRYGGAFENFERARKRLQMVVPVALLLIFILIYFALKSFRQTTMIYIAIPLAAIGGVISLWLRDMPFSISAGVGFIVLFGVAVLNGLVLISSFNELKEEGMTDLRKRISLGTSRRIRPILLTALTDVLGFLPMAVSSSAGAEVQRPLATVVIGGLITSTLLTLFILPILYRWTENRRNLRIQKPILSIFVIAFGLIGLKTNAQEGNTSEVISKEQAVEIALKNYPKLKNAQRRISQQKAMKGAAWDLGKTTVFTSGEEISEAGGTYTTYGIQQQGMDLLGIPAKKRFYQDQVKLTEKQLELSELEVATEVKKAWSMAQIAKKRLELFQRLDSLYGQLERAVNLRYETEAISRLEMLAAKNRIQEIEIQKKQARNDYLQFRQKLQVWLGSDFEVPSQTEISEELLGQNFPELANDHPNLLVSEERLEVASSRIAKERSRFLPDLNLQYGKQQINGNDRFFSFQAGLSIPLFSGEAHAQVKTARIEQEIAKENMHFQQLQLKSSYLAAIQNYEKWKSSWSFYQDEVLPLLTEQRKGSLLAFNEGAIGYTELIQNLDNALQSELRALDALKNYQLAVADIEFFLNKK